MIIVASGLIINQKKTKIVQFIQNQTLYNNLPDEFLRQWMHSKYELHRDAVEYRVSWLERIFFESLAMETPV